MVVEVKNLVTGETKPVLAPSVKTAVALAAAEEQYPHNPFRELKAFSRLRRQLRRGTHTVFCGNWMADLGGR